MDELELLKSKWQLQEHDLPKLTFNDIYKMLLKKSSSIVKWIFYISIGELLFWATLAFLVPDSTQAFVEEMGLDNVFLVVNIIHYCVFAFFIFLFWKNHKKIQATDSISTLMKNILKTRQTVKYFVIYNIGTTILLMIGVNIFYYQNGEALEKAVKHNTKQYDAIPPELFLEKFMLLNIIGGVIMLGLVLLFYFLIYGFLLKRLKRNYKELQKMEM